jgi:hypothetical protein
MASIVPFRITMSEAGALSGRTLRMMIVVMAAVAPARADGSSSDENKKDVPVGENPRPAHLRTSG